MVHPIDTPQDHPGHCRVRRDTAYLVDVEQTQRRWPDPETGPYLLTLKWARVDGRPKLAGVHVDLDDLQGPPVTTSLLRDLKLGEIMVEDREKLPYEPVIQQLTEPLSVKVAGLRPATARRLHRAAELYVAAWRAGEPPTKAVEREMNVTPAAAANLVRRAREVGLLPPTTPGRSQA